MPQYSLALQQKRKQVKKSVMRRYPGRDFRWFYGVLHDFGPIGVRSAIMEPRPVSGVTMLPKDGGTARSFGDVHATFPSFRQERELPRYAPSSRPAAQEDFSKIIRYRDLLEAFDYDGECSKCHKYPNIAVERQTSDHGWKNIIICRGCGYVMRPYGS